MRLCYILHKNDEYVGHIIFIKNRNKITIIDLFIEIKHQRKSYGTFLLQKVINFGKNFHVDIILIDDMSLMYRQPSHNIYCKHGFNYIHEYGPEMILNL